MENAGREEKAKVSFHWARRVVECDQNISGLLSRFLLSPADTRRQVTEHIAFNLEFVSNATQQGHFIKARPRAVVLGSFVEKNNRL